jgi:hypothetical protein
VFAWLIYDDVAAFIECNSWKNKNEASLLGSFFGLLFVERTAK